MKKEEPELLTIPLEFKIACATYHLPVAEVLQQFIDHISFYDSLSYKSNDSYRFATNTLLSYPQPTVQGMNPAFRKSREAIIKYIRQIVQMSVKPGTVELKRRKLCIPIIKKIFQLMERGHTASGTLQLDETTSLQLGMDFCIMCETHNCPPQHYLQHFMNQISLPETHARIGLHCALENHAMAFFYRTITKCNALLYSSAQKALQIEFIDSIQELHLRLFIVRDLEKRREKYHELYQDYYHKLIQAS
ncbi:hypothetical protein [Pedobacter steynii]|uniref:Uncharacterized protein n=1 Tax=Pedobacter steynii TaxID=430522 RepID=A0A1D7QF67_9SPHI|nr:hypothetical protein [Pedobacter steynii]AOM77255.1 hypothetical protein BFS30_08830 [Pedobacter steynii]